MVGSRLFQHHVPLRERDRSRESGKPAFIYHLGDSDPSGENAAEVIERELRAYAPGTEIHFERLAVTVSRSATGVYRPVRRSSPTFGPLHMVIATASSWTASIQTLCASSSRMRSKAHVEKALAKLMKAEKAEHDEIRELVDQIS